MTCPWPSPDASTARYVGPGVIACLPLILKDTGRNRDESTVIESTTPVNRPLVTRVGIETTTY